MPYIKQDQRKTIDPLVRQLADRIVQSDMKNQDGELNYAIHKLLLEIYKPESYFAYNRSLGVLNAVNQEWYRRFVSEYEQKKIVENGDLT